MAATCEKWRKCSALGVDMRRSGYMRVIYSYSPLIENSFCWG